ncbi:MAG TPA: DUF58 domain-containing protein [Candidatus Acidoferrum sp.]|nr:DUF58 domain-containing protein [Candidatus Acidoferrum sp.]
MGAIPKTLYRVHFRLLDLLGWGQRRFTGTGLALLAGLFVVGLAGLDPDLSASYQAFSVLLCLLLVALCFTGAFPASFKVRRQLPAFGTAGCPIKYRVVVRNLTAKKQEGLTLLESLVEARPGFQEWWAFQVAEQRLLRSFRVSHRRRGDPFKTATVKPVALPSALPHQETEAQVEVTPLRRGVLRFTGVVLARPDPLGLVRTCQIHPLAQSILVLPKRYALPAIALPGTMKYQQGGVALAASVGQSDEFVALRDYRNGDPYRHIHWRSWAKAGKPVVKEFEDEFFVRHGLVLDTFADHPHSEAFEEAVSVAASFVCTIQTQESLLDLLFVGPHSYCFTAGRGLGHAEQMLELLASVRTCHDHPFRALEHLVLTHVGSLSGCICVLVAWEAERQRLVEKLLRLGVPALVLVIVEPGAETALDPGPLRDKAEWFHVLEAGKVEEGLRRLG